LCKRAISFKVYTEIIAMLPTKSSTKVGCDTPAPALGRAYHDVYTG